MKTINVKDIKFAAWNTRGEISADSVAELVKSIQTNGLITPITLWQNGKAAVCVAGARRLTALKLMKTATIEEGKHFRWHVGDEASAKMVTIVENLQREDIDPIAEAALVKKMLDDGNRVEYIADKTGKGVAWVRRRAKLLGLDAKLAEAVKKTPKKFSVAGLEIVAELPENAQKAVVSTILGLIGWKDSITLKDVKDEVARVGNVLDGAPFLKDATACKVCKGCDKRTGCQADLFGEQRGKLGTCLDAKCFASRLNYYEKSAIAAAVGDAETVRLKYAWEAPREADGKKRDKKHPCAYVQVGNGEVKVLWGPSKKESDAKKKAADEAKREKYDEAEEVRRRVRDIVGKLDDSLRDADPMPDALEGAIRRLVVAGLPETELAVRAIGEFICEHHTVDVWAEIVRTFKFVQTVVGLTDADVEFLAKNANA